MQYLAILLAGIVLLAAGVDAQYTKAANCSVDDFENSFVRAYGHFGNVNQRLPDTAARLTSYCK